MFGQVYVSQDWAPGLPADIVEGAKGRVQPQAARGVGAGAVGLVEGGFENQRQVETRGDLVQRIGDFDRLGDRLTGAGDQHQRLAAAMAKGQVDAHAGRKVS